MQKKFKCYSSCSAASSTTAVFLFLYRNIMLKYYYCDHSVANNGSRPFPLSCVKEVGTPFHSKLRVSRRSRLRYDEWAKVSLFNLEPIRRYNVSHQQYNNSNQLVNKYQLSTHLSAFSIIAFYCFRCAPRLFLTRFPKRGSLRKVQLASTQHGGARGDRKGRPRVAPFS